MAEKKMVVGKTCNCMCHGVKHWAIGGSLVLLGAVGLWWHDYFMALLYWLLLLHGLLCLGHKMCKCC